MTKFDWEKDPFAKMVRHQKNRQTQKDYLKKKTAKLIKKERELQAPYQSGVNAGREQERERIIKILMDYAPHLTTEGLMQQIKGEHK